MSKKSGKILDLIAGCQGRGRDAHYLGYFACFNQGLYYEAHDVLEELWLPIRRESAGNFYKGLIQLAGAFVHLQKNRLKPADALFRLAEDNLRGYAPVREGLDLDVVLALIATWRARLADGAWARNPLLTESAPRLVLRERG